MKKLYSGLLLAIALLCLGVQNVKADQDFSAHFYLIGNMTGGNWNSDQTKYAINKQYQSTTGKYYIEVDVTAGQEYYFALYNGSNQYGPQIDGSVPNTTGAYYTNAWKYTPTSSKIWVCVDETSTVVNDNGYFPWVWVEEVVTNGGTLNSCYHPLGDFAANATASYKFTPSATGFYTFTTNNENAWVDVYEGSNSSSPLANGYKSCGGKFTAGTTYTVRVSNTKSEEMTGLTLTIVQTVPAVLNTGSNSVTIPTTTDVPNFAFTPAESGDYIFSISNFNTAYQTGNLLSLYDCQATYKSNGDVIAMDLQAGTTYYLYAYGAVSNAAIEVASFTIMDKVVYNGSNTLTFYHDTANHSGDGNTVYKIPDYSSNSVASIWRTTAANVTTVVFDESCANARLDNCYGWFYDFEKLATVTGMQYLNMSEATLTGYMFYNCKALETITLPSTLKTIGESMFGGDCTALTTVNLQSVPQVAAGAFSGVNSSCAYTLALDDNSYIYTGENNLPSSFKTTSYTRNMSNQWGTLCLPFAITSNSDYQIYTLSDVTTGTDGAMTFSPATEAAANNPCVFKKNNNATSVTFSATDATVSATSNPTATTSVDGLSIKGTYTALPDQTGMYFIAQDKFWKADAAISIAPFRAWFEGTLPTEAKSFNIIEGDELTGIGRIENGELRIENSGKYLENGRIVIIKNNKKFNVNGQEIK